MENTTGIVVLQFPLSFGEYGDRSRLVRMNEWMRARERIADRRDQLRGSDRGIGPAIDGTFLTRGSFVIEEALQVEAFHPPL